MVSLTVTSHSYNMVGQFKFSMVILGGFVLFRDPLQALQLLGILFTFAGERASERSTIA